MSEAAPEDLRAEVARAEVELVRAQAIVEDLEAELVAMPASVPEIEQRIADVRASSIRFVVAGVVILLLWIAGIVWWQEKGIFHEPFDASAGLARVEAERERLDGSYRAPAEVDAASPEAAPRWTRIGAAACRVGQLRYADHAAEVLRLSRANQALQRLRERCEAKGVDLSPP